jgi:hypothetical protein
MEIEEMKDLWEEMSKEIEKQKKITDSLIIKMIHRDYKNKIHKILIPEVVGTSVCFAAVLFIVVNFQKLNTWYLLACGIMSAFILIVLPMLSIRAIHSMRTVNISSNNYKQSLLEYSKGKMQLVFVQKLSFYLGAILIVVILPVMGQIIAGKNLFMTTSLWFLYVIAFPFFYAFAKWVFKSYRKSASEAEIVLKELDS